MRLARAFSTTLRHKKQALYEPYSPPLSSEHKKALRKIMNAQAPKFNGRFNKDVHRTLEAYSPKGYTLEDRLRTIQLVTKIIKSAFGPDYSVLDRSMSQYCKDFVYAPLELAILDESRPAGIPPDEIGPQFPDAYNHEALARLLQRHGYSGSFVAGDAMRNQPPKEYFDRDPNSSIDRGPFPLAHPWPSYSPYPTFHLTYPPVLWADPGTTNGDTLPFFLSPPVPVYTPLLRLLKAYSSASDEIQDVITFIFLWTRSVNLVEFTPTCIALMVIAVFQHKRHIPNLQIPEDPQVILKLSEQNDGVWFTRATPTNGGRDRMYSSTWLETGFYPSPPLSKYPKKMSRLLHEFFSFWGQHQLDATFISTAQYVSLREGGVLNRQTKMALGLDVRNVLRQDDEDIVDGKVPAPDDQPKMWQSQSLVVQDPFVPSYNHAQSISKIAGTFFHYYCTLSRRTMSRGHPMHTIIGPHLSPPRRSPKSAVRSYSTATISQEITHMYEASIPPRPVLDARNMTISRVQNAIHKKFGRGYTVECFGSTRYGVSTPTSDLDLVVIDKKNINGFRFPVLPRNLPNVYNVWVVSRLLMNSGFTQVVAIPKAKVPIVKFRDPKSNLDCDLNINEQLGLWNTRLTAQYCDLAPDILRPLIVVIKRWAKSNGLNDPSGSSGPVSFSSYALILMTIGYLQLKGVLPTLQGGLDPLPPNAKQGVFWLRAPGVQGTPCDIRFRYGHDWTPRVHLSLEEALMGWFDFWGNEFQYEENILSIRDGVLGIRTRKKKPTKRKKKEKNSADRMSDTEIQQLRREEAEEAALDAFADQHESEESESVSDTDEEESTNLTAPDHVLEGLARPTQDQEGRTDLERFFKKTPEQIIETQTDTDILQEDAPETSQRSETNSETSSETREPARWANDMLVVADPFVRSKNVCGGIWKGNTIRFREECRSCVSLLEWGSGLESLMGDLEFKKHEKQNRGRGGKGGKKKGSKKSGVVDARPDPAPTGGIGGGKGESGSQGDPSSTTERGPNKDGEASVETAAGAG